VSKRERERERQRGERESIRREDNRNKDKLA
jgi:hypothetical protein